MYDLIIEGGFIVDGKGNEGYRGDIGINKDAISRIGNLEDKESKRRINAEGYIVCPGFIDIHSHSDFHIMEFPHESNKVIQGVTTEVTGHCGFSPFPILHERIPYFKGLMEANNVKEPESGYSTEEFINNLEKVDIGINIAPLVGHGIIRINAMGFDNRKPTDDEMNIMKNLLQEAMEAGCYGISSGLGYPPGFFADTEELIELSKVVSKYNGIYASHLRNQEDKLLDAIQEALSIGEKSRVSVNISHLKACGKNNWGNIKSAIELIDVSRENGLNAICDFYPYDATCNPLSSLLPRWLHEGGTERFIERIKNDDNRKIIDEEMVSWDNEAWSRIIISRVGSKSNKDLEGKDVLSLAKERDVTPLEFALNLLVEENEAVESICRFMCEEDIEYISAYPFAAVGSDAYAKPDNNKDFRGHPRNYGTFPRFLSRFIREKNIITLEEGIRRITSFPAEFLNIKDRGSIEEGKYADIVIFHKDRIIDRNTYENPGLYPEGVEYVIVNGQIQIEGEKHHKVPAGRILRKGR